MTRGRLRDAAMDLVEALAFFFKAIRISSSLESTMGRHNVGIIIKKYVFFEYFAIFSDNNVK